MEKHSFAELEELYEASESSDKAIFSEMRSNLLLIDGDHYSRRTSDFYRRIRSSKELTDQQKIRLVKNHTEKIVGIYVGNVVSSVPGVGFFPANETELRDQKSAELHNKVWNHAKAESDLDSLIEDWADDFVGLGEVAVKVFYDPGEGKLLAYHQALDSETGEPEFDENGALKPGEPVYEGNLVFETIHAFNLFRSPEAQDIRKSRMLGVKKMVKREKLIRLFPEHEQLIVESYDETMVVFDSDKNNFRRTKGEVFVREFYFRPGLRYPRGWFFIVTGRGILADGELPAGTFPIEVEAYRKVQTSPRGRSPVRTIRPYQAEINRTASKIAEHQVVLGDDKIITLAGTKLSEGLSLPGIRHLKTDGGEPAILQGRDGSQFVQHMSNTITELYQVMNVSEETEPDPITGQVDSYALLFRSARQKKRFVRVVRRFERFLCRVALLHGKLAKFYYSDSRLTEILGADERENLTEFRNPSKLCYQVKALPQSDDVETAFGKQLVLNQILQYVGSQLSPEDIGSIIEAMPYGNSKAITSDLTLNRRVVTNDILALDRGERPPIHPYDEHEYMIKRLVSRMREPDFKHLSEEIRANYAENVAIREQMNAEKLRQLQEMKNELIPTGGYLVVVDLYVPDPGNPMKTRRARIPYDSVKWLIDKLQMQGKTLEQLEAMNRAALAEMATMAKQSGGVEQSALPPAVGEGGNVNGVNAFDYPSIIA